jgi:sugar (pentulose or hexulose) kinase
LSTGVGASVEQACKASIKQVGKTMPNKKSSAAYDRSYAVYHKLYVDLKDRFGEIAALAR